MSTNKNFNESQRARDKKGQFARTNTPATTPKKQRSAPKPPPHVAKNKKKNIHTPASTVGSTHLTFTKTLTKTHARQRNEIRMRKIAVRRIYEDAASIIYGDPKDPQVIAGRQKFDNALKAIGFPHGIDWNINS